MFWKFLYLFFTPLLFCGCAHYKLADSDQRYPHPANSCVSVLPLKTSQTLDIEEENLPKKSKKDPKMHHMHNGSHTSNEKEYGDDGTV